MTDSSAVRSTDPAEEAVRIDRVLGAGTAAFMALLDASVDVAAQDPAAVRAVLSQPGARRELRESAVRNRDRIDALLAKCADDDPAVLLARAVQAAAAGDTDREVELVRRGLAADPDCRLLALHAAELADDAGDAHAAVALYRRAGLDPFAPDVPLQVGLYARPLDAPVGRNAPCPCGSGRKYKTCCWQRTSDWPLPLRANWLVDKLLRGAQSDPVYENELERRRRRVGLASAEHDEVVALFLEHCLLFSPDPSGNGSFATSVVRRRRAVYPPDEVALATSWSDVTPAMYRVTAVGDGTVTLRRADHWSGRASADPADIAVVDPAVAAAVAPGRSVLAVAVPVGDAVRVVGPVLFVPQDAADPVAATVDVDDALRLLLAD